jgi:hypothetical protein
MEHRKNDCRWKNGTKEWWASWVVQIEVKTVSSSALIQYESVNAPLKSCLKPYGSQFWQHFHLQSFTDQGGGLTMKDASPEGWGKLLNWINPSPSLLITLQSQSSNSKSTSGSVYIGPPKSQSVWLKVPIRIPHLGTLNKEKEDSTLALEMGDWHPDIRPSRHPHPYPHPLAGILRYLPSKGPAGRASFQPSRYLYLAGWKGFPPAAGILWDTRIPASDLWKRGHPHLLAGIRDGYPLTISTWPKDNEVWATLPTIILRSTPVDPQLSHWGKTLTDHDHFFALQQSQRSTLESLWGEVKPEITCWLLWFTSQPQFHSSLYDHHHHTSISTQE